MQLHTVTELLGIANYKVSHMINHSESSIVLVLQHIEDTPSICSGCGKAHHTPVHSIDTVIAEDLPISGSGLKSSHGYGLLDDLLIIYIG